MDETQQMIFLCREMTEQQLRDWLTIIRHVSLTGSDWPLLLLDATPMTCRSAMLRALAGVLRVDTGTVILGALVIVLTAALLLF